MKNNNFYRFFLSGATSFFDYWNPENPCNEHQEFH